MKVGLAGHAVLAEARRHVWAVRPEFWDSFARLLAADHLPLAEAPALEVQSAARRRGGDRKARSAVAVVGLHGLITPRASILSLLFGGGGGLTAFRETLREAVADDDVDAIVLDVDSPGGSTALVEETAADIRAAREVKPVVAVANTDAGSAAYWIAAQANELVVTPSGMVGSIGAFIVHEDYSGLNEQLGVEVTYVASGRYKTEGNPDEPLSDEARDYLQSIVDEAHGTFVRDVAIGRGATEKSVRAGYGEGRMLTSARALDAGMVDRVGTLEETVGALLAGEDVRPGRRAAGPSDPRPSVLGAANEAGADEDREASRPRKSLEDDQAMVDGIIATY